MYSLFLDDMDIFTIVTNIQKRNELAEQKIVMTDKATEQRNTLKKLRKTYYLEHYARSKKFFKQADEDIFVVIPKKKPVE